MVASNLKTVYRRLLRRHGSLILSDCRQYGGGMVASEEEETQ